MKTWSKSELESQRADSEQRLIKLKIHESFMFEIGALDMPKQYWLVTRVKTGWIYENTPNGSGHFNSIFVPLFII